MNFYKIRHLIILMYLIHKGHTPCISNLEEGSVYTDDSASVQELVHACIFWNAEQTPNPAFATWLTIFTRLIRFYYYRERQRKINQLHATTECFLEMVKYNRLGTSLKLAYSGSNLVLFLRFMTIRKLFNLSAPQCLHLRNGDNSSFIRLLG